MATGLKVPVGVNKKGRAAVETDESSNTQKILQLAFSEGGDNNPFQALGIDSRLVFGIKSPAFRGKVVQAILRIASKFTELIRIDENTIEFIEDIEAEFEVSFKYIDLLTNSEEEFRIGFRR